MEVNNVEEIFIGDKEISKYISACFYSLGKEKNILLKARGNNIKRAIDVLAILKRDYLENPKYTIEVDSEKYHDKETNRERNVSTVEISLSGTKKGKK